MRVDYDQRGRDRARRRRTDPRIAEPPDGAGDRIVERLRAALSAGERDACRGHLRDMGSFDGALRLVVSR